MGWNRSGVLAGGTLVVSMLGTGCEPPKFLSEGGLLEFSDKELGASTASTGISSGDALLVGTPVCPDLGRTENVDTDAPADADPSTDTDAPIGAAPTDTGAACSAGELTGATWEGDCFSADAPGQIVWRFDAGDCGVDPLPTDDEFHLRSVAPEDVSARVDFWTEAAAEALGLHASGDVDALALPAPHTTVNVLADTPTGFDVRLDALNPDDSTTPTAFRIPDVVWSMSGFGTAKRSDDGYAVVDVPADNEDELWMNVAGAQFEVGAFRGVVPKDVDHLSLVAWSGTPDTSPGPVGARALGVTATGEPVFGLDVNWSVLHGPLAISRVLYAGQPGYVSVSDTCIPPSKRGGPRTATLRASWGLLTATVDLAWEGTAGTSEDDADFVRDPNCQGACGCASAPTPTGAGALLGFVAITARRRRRAG